MALTTINTYSGGFPGVSAAVSGIYSATSANISEEFQGNAKAKDHTGSIAAAYLHRAIGTIEVQGYAGAYSAPELGSTVTAEGKTATVVNASFGATSQDFAKASATGKYTVAA